MTKITTSIIAVSLVASALFMGSSALMAGNHGEQHRGDSHNTTEMGKKSHKGKGNLNKEEHQARMEGRREAMAERLKLNDEQRKIWNEIQDEHREKSGKHEKRLEK